MVCWTNSLNGRGGSCAPYVTSPLPSSSTRRKTSATSGGDATPRNARAKAGPGPPPEGASDTQRLGPAMGRSTTSPGGGGAGREEGGQAWLGGALRVDVTGALLLDIAGRPPGGRTAATHCLGAAGTTPLRRGERCWRPCTNAGLPGGGRGKRHGQGPASPQLRAYGRMEGRQNQYFRDNSSCWGSGTVGPANHMHEPWAKQYPR